MSRRIPLALALLGLLITTGVIYVMSGVNTAYLAADDFSLVTDAHAFLESPHIPVLAGDGFYRPLVPFWFAGLLRTCGSSTRCFHTVHLNVHLANVAIVFALFALLSNSWRVSFLGGLLFALQPSYTQAVVWLAAITELSATGCMVASLCAQAWSWRVDTRSARRLLEAAAIVFFAGALCFHESAVTLPVLAWLMWRWFGPSDLTRRRVLALGFVICLAGFGAFTVASNRHNPLIEGHTYVVGPHMLRHALDYMVGMYVGPGGTIPYLACIVAIILMISANRLARFGAAWLLISMTPFLGFTWGNASRYAYVPSIGFALAVSAIGVAAADALEHRLPRGKIVSGTVYALLALFIGIRFGNFCVHAISSQVRWTHEWKNAAGELRARAGDPIDGRIRVTGRPSIIDAIYVQPVLRWERKDYTLTVIQN